MTTDNLTEKEIKARDSAVEAFVGQVEMAEALDVSNIQISAAYARLIVDEIWRLKRAIVYLTYC